MEAKIRPRVNPEPHKTRGKPVCAQIRETAAPGVWFRVEAGEAEAGEREGGRCGGKG